jgi:dolichol-phosphate mannosyltransferase
MGALIIVISTPLGLSMFVEEYLLHDPWQLHITGTSMLAMFILFLIGIVLAAVGLMSLYIAAIHTEVTNRPLYVVKKKINID